MRSIRVLFSFIILFGCLSTTRGQSFLKSLTEEEVGEIKSSIESMKKDARGPYLRIRWFCADGKFLDAPKDNYRLKEFILEKYLVETDDGWVLRQAQYYRGARQIEDEEKQGQ